VLTGCLSEWHLYLQILFVFPAPTLRDEEDELLQLAIQQSLLEYGGGINLQEREGEENVEDEDDEMLQR